MAKLAKVAKLAIGAALAYLAAVAVKALLATPAPKDSSNELQHLFDSQENIYDAHLPAMPDDGCKKLKINGIGGTLGKVFNDSNYLHLAAASAIGIEPISDPAQILQMPQELVKLENCREYYVDELHHSYPYLVPEAEALLREIGDRFNHELADRGGGSYRIKVSSVLRTPESVGKLRRVNRNASAASAHQFATTFDISYNKFICDSITVGRTAEDLKNLLAEVLNGLRNEGRCYVKHERKQACFHITAR